MLERKPLVVAVRQERRGNYRLLIFRIARRKDKRGLVVKKCPHVQHPLLARRYHFRDEVANAAHFLADELGTFSSRYGRTVRHNRTLTSSRPFDTSQTVTLTTRFEAQMIVLEEEARQWELKHPKRK